MPSLPTYPEALSAALSLVESSLGVETVPLNQAADRVLAEPILADRDTPPFDRAMMDGYALRAAELKPGVPMPVAGAIAAGTAADASIPPGACVKIATGAPVPPGLDAVIRHEWSDRADPVRFTVGSINKGHAIHPRGADARRGDVVVPGSTVLRPEHLGIAAAMGATLLSVRRRPRVAILTSGDEVRPADATVLDHQIRNSNAPMLADAARRFGAMVTHVEHVPDDDALTAAAFEHALARCDLLLSVGGVSAGERDHFPSAYRRAGVTMAVSGAAIQPGRPITVGRAPNGVIVAGLPGNPVSALACAHLFVWPIVRSMLGLDPWLRWEARTLAQPVTPNAQRQAFRPARLNRDGTIAVPRWAGSGDLVHTGQTDGLAELPVQVDDVPTGAAVRFVAWAS